MVATYVPPESDAGALAAVTAEAVARAAADSAEVTARTNAINAAITGEATTRAAADTANADAISAEATARIAADTTLTTAVGLKASTAALTAETTARTDADTGLDGRLATVESGSLLKAARSELAVNVMDPAFAPSVLHTTGAVGDGAVHPLSDYFASVPAAQAVYPFVTALTQQRDWAAIEKARRSIPTRGGVVRIPAGDYRCGNTGFTWNDRPIHFLGDGMGLQPNTGTRLRFDAGVAAFTIQNGPSGLGHFSGLEGLRITGADVASGANDGVRLQTNSGLLRRILVENFAGYGINVLSTVSPDPEEVAINANSCRIDSIQCFGNFSGGLHTQGIDSNAGTFTDLHLQNNGGYGLELESNLGNHILGVHLSGNTTGGMRLTGPRNWVGGIYYESENKPAATLTAGAGQNFLHFTSCSRPDAADPISDSATGGNEIILENGGQHHRRIQIGPSTSGYVEITPGAVATALSFHKGAGARFKNPLEDTNWDVLAVAGGALTIASAQNGPVQIGNPLTLNGATKAALSLKRTNRSITGAAPTIDVSSGNWQNCTMTGNVTGLVFTNPTDGQEVELHLIQDATGSRTATWASNFKWIGGAPPALTTTPNMRDIFKFRYSSATGFWYESSPPAMNVG